MSSILDGLVKVLKRALSFLTLRHADELELGGICTKINIKSQKALKLVPCLEKWFSLSLVAEN